MQRLHYFFIVTFLLLSMQSIAQRSVSDSSIFIPSVGVHFSYHIPSGDLSHFYGNASAIGADFNFKLKSQWILGTFFEYYFSDNIKDRAGYFKGIQNSQGFVIDGNGQFAEIFLYERGFNIQAYAGYQFNVLSPNPNSGPFIEVGVGYMQYWTKIENPGMTAPQINGKYMKMYDRLSGGISSTQLIGYRYMGDRNLMNIYAGFEFTQGWTKSLRSYNADFAPGATLNYFVWTTAFKVGWVIPFYPRTPKKYYYY